MPVPLTTPSAGGDAERTRPALAGPSLALWATPTIRLMDPRGVAALCCVVFMQMS